MSKVLLPLLSGFVLGAASWFVVPLVSNKFEPYDSDAGLYLGQALMSVAAFYFGLSQGIKSVLVFLAGVYISLNLYPYMFGTSDHRAWALLGLFMTVLLCICPLAIGLLGKAVSFWQMKCNNRLKNDAAKRSAS